MRINKEKKYENIYGDTFGLYSKNELIEFIKPLKERFKKNKINPKKLFEGKRCIDAGCGNGRGAIFMLMNGAREVTCVDFSKKNILTTKKMLKNFNFKNYKLINASLEKLNLPENYFDFVWCNGVIMHTKNPKKCMYNLTKILKLNGKMWLYVYGAGGLYWRIIFNFRKLFKNSNIKKTIKHLKDLKYSSRYIAEYIDDWYAVFLRSYSSMVFSKYLKNCGYSNFFPLKRGVSYDSSEKKYILNKNKKKINISNTIYGEGDLRFLLTKKKIIKNIKSFKDFNSVYGSNYNWENKIKSFDFIYNDLKKTSFKLRIKLCAEIQYYLRKEIAKKSISLNNVKKKIKEIIQKK